MRMKICVLMLSLTLSACAATKPQWIGERSNLKKGQSADFVVKKLGEPYRRYADANQNEFWEYRKSAEKKEVLNWIAALGTCGILSGDNNYYSDILVVNLKSHKVSNFCYRESVNTVFSDPNINCQ